ncbi:3-oxoadipate enol-lactonase [uncultured Roseicyclus sp.]|jgi:3-oxoadipate enol-lactonase|uniref:3-oxoadipate enol-lactonase n=1 Tax=uncultured Roseicyclus sp. TaxID=543072 RepID=UPI00262D9295|nr:3-oxoadipate enol-lactonase [uncultured Roseicyclus sp.]
MTAGRVDLGAITLNCRVDGAEGRDWLILSNSLGATMAMWEDQMPALSARYRVLRYDTRGHGQSDAPEGPYSFADLTGDVVALMDHFGIERTAFMGLSMGGMTGLGLAIDHAPRVSRVVCADGRADAPEGFRTMWDTRIARVREGGLAAIVQGTVESWLTEAWRIANPDRVTAIAQMVQSNNPEGYVACCLALKDLDYLKRLPQAGVPILYVGGDQDRGAAPEVMQAMADATPGGVYRQIAGAAHVANINAPEAYLDAIADFFEL